MSLRRPGLAAQTGTDHYRVGPSDQIEQRRRRRLVELMREGLHVRLCLHERRDRLGRRHRVHQAGPGAERRPRRHPNGAGHPGVAAHDHHSAPLTLVVPSPEPAQPLGGLDVGDHGRPARIGGRVTDVGHDEVAHLVPRQQVPPAEAAEGDGDIGPGGRREPCRSTDRPRWARRWRGPEPRDRAFARGARRPPAGARPTAPVPSSASTASPRWATVRRAPTSRTPSARANLRHALPQRRSRARSTPPRPEHRAGAGPGRPPSRRHRCCPAPRRPARRLEAGADSDPPAPLPPPGRRSP